MYLVYSPIFTSPLSICLGGVLSDLPEISNQNKSFRSIETIDSGLLSYDLIDKNVEDWNYEDSYSKGLQGMLDGFNLSGVEEVNDSHSCSTEEEQKCLNDLSPSREHFAEALEDIQYLNEIS